MADHCLEMGCEVHGAYRWRSDTSNIEHIKERVSLHECDLTDSTAVRKIIRDVRPERIFHLAAQSYVHASWSEPSHTLSNNILSQVNIFEAVRHIPDYSPRIQIACSSEEYGKSDKKITEETPLNPLSPYAVSKIAQDFLGYQYFKSYGLYIVRTRGFNHTGPRRGEVFVCSTFAKQIAEIEKGKEPIIYVGNLDAKRDFTDVRDMVQGYWLALEKGKPGEVYNICSGTAHSMREILYMLRGMSRKKIEIEIDQDRLRPSDVPVLLGDNSKFKKQTGWEPRIPFQKTLEDLLTYWRGKCTASAGD